MARVVSGGSDPFAGGVFSSLRADKSADFCCKWLNLEANSLVDEYMDDRFSRAENRKGRADYKTMMEFSVIHIKA